MKISTYRGLPIPASPRLELFVQPNPSYGAMSENLSDDEIATNNAEREHEERLDQLERDVVSEAVDWFSTTGFPAGTVSPLRDAVSALLQERSRK